MSEDELPDQTVVEMCALVQGEFARFGIPGQVQVTGTFIELISAQGKQSFPIGAWWRSWPEMDETAKASNAAHLARQLKEVRNASRAPSQLPVRRDHSTLQFFLAVTVIGGALAWFLGFDPLALMDRAIAGESVVAVTDDKEVKRSGKEGGDSKASPRPITEDGAGRAARICGATRTRLLKGGSVGIADVDGWVVDILVAKTGSSDPLAKHPALRRYVADPAAPAGSKMVWPAVSSLVRVDTSSTLAELHGAVWGEGQAAVSSLRMVLKGSLVDPFFDEKTRGIVNGVADSLVSDLEASHAAVYARCAGSELAVMGSWFWGEDVPAVSTALLYSMGMRAEPRHIASPFFRAPGEKKANFALAFSNIGKHTASLDDAGLSAVVGKLSGKLVPRPKGGVIVTFPFRDGGRAVRTSKMLAGATHLGKR